SGSEEVRGNRLRERLVVERYPIPVDVESGARRHGVERGLELSLAPEDGERRLCRVRRGNRRDDAASEDGEREQDSERTAAPRAEVLSRDTWKASNHSQQLLNFRLQATPIAIAC